MGMYKTAMPMHRMEIRNGEMRFCTSSLELLGAVVLIQRNRPDQQYQKCDGDRGGHWPIAVAEELVPQHTADHEIVGAAEQSRDDEFPDGRYEHQHGARDDPRHRQRQRHVQKRPPWWTSQIACR